MRPVFCALLPLLLSGETYTLTLRQAVAQAMQQNPDLVLARIDEQKSTEGVRISRDPFHPKLILGSGLAYSNGFPMSIEGASPSIVQARAVQAIFNRPKSYEVAMAKENARAATIDTASKRDEVAYRVALLFEDLEQLQESGEMAGKQVQSLEKVLSSVEARVGEGRELPIENRRASFNLAQARQTLSNLEGDIEYIQSSLALALGYTAEDRVIATPSVLEGGEAPAGEGEGVKSALDNSTQLKRLESALQVKGLEVKSTKAARLPQLDLVAQYGLFAKFNNYEDYFRTFQRNNGQIGMSVQWPVLAGSAASAQEARARLDISRLRTEMTSARDRIEVETRHAYSQLRRNRAARDVVRLDLELTREQLSVLLAQQEEGRATLRQVEELRSQESAKWIAYYAAEHQVERALLDVLRQTGTLQAALR